MKERIIGQVWLLSEVVSTRAAQQGLVVCSCELTSRRAYFLHLSLNNVQNVPFW